MTIFKGKHLEVLSLETLCENVTDRRLLFRDSDVNRVAEIYPAETFDCRPPLNIENNPDADLFVNSPIPHLYDTTHRAGPATFAALSNIHLVTPHGFLVNAENRMIAESYHNAEMLNIPLREVHSLLANGLIESGSTQEVEAPALLLMGPWSWIYHHWMMEDLPRLWALDEFPELTEIPIVVPAGLSSFQQESLAAFGIDESRLLPFDGSNWRFKRLYVPSFLAPGGHSRRQIDWIRKKLFNALAVGPTSMLDRRLYISREDANTRRVVNEEAVVSFLHSNGFETVNPGTLSLAEQLKLFSEAAIICGTSGSGLINHIFAPERTTLIEMQPDSYINRAHWFTSNICNQDYAFLIGHAETESHDYRVDLDKLAETLAFVLA